MTSCIKHEPLRNCPRARINDQVVHELQVGSKRSGFSYTVTDEQATKIFSYYEQLPAGATKRRISFQSLLTASKYNEERGMSDVEKIAARGSSFGFWPSHIFMPADAQVMLETEKKYVASKIESYGKGRK